jgi:hypothetical protein
LPKLANASEGDQWGLVESKRGNRLKADGEAGVENCMRQTAMVLMEECGSSMSEEVQLQGIHHKRLDPDGYSRH